MEDCAHAFAEAEGAEDAGGFGGQTDGGADESYAEEGHVCGRDVVWWVWMWEDQGGCGGGFVGGV